MAEKLVEQYIHDFRWCRAFGKSRHHNVRWGCRSHEISVFCIEAGRYRTDHGLSPEDLARLQDHFTVGRWRRP